MAGFLFLFFVFWQVFCFLFFCFDLFFVLSQKWALPAGFQKTWSQAPEKSVSFEKVRILTPNFDGGLLRASQG